ncbi:MAG: (Fe-S)-binding protein, partial [Bacteroidales bacterium]
NHTPLHKLAGELSCNHFSGIKKGVRTLLSAADMTHRLIGTRSMKTITLSLHKGTDKLIPLWTPAMPKPFRAKTKELITEAQTQKVVYFPSCINQTFGSSESNDLPLMNVFSNLLIRAGYEVVYPAKMDKLCCGTIWESKGMPEIADKKTEELENALWEASEGGRFPIVCDQSPCLYRMRKEFKRLRPYETAEFLNKFVAGKLTFYSKKEIVAIHPTCSTRKMNLTEELVSLASLCSEKVFIPEEVGCCGFAGDKGFTHPEVNTYALRKLKPQLEKMKIQEGYSNSRTCEIGLTTNSGISYKSIVYLVDECTTQNK